MEVLFVTNGVAALLRDNKSVQIPSIMQASRKMGMCLMDDSFQQLIDAGIIDGEVAYRYAEDKSKFECYKDSEISSGQPAFDHSTAF